MKNLKILIIDDNRDYHATMSKFLALTGTHMAFSAYTGRDGLEKAVEVKPDAILLDMNLPDMRGTEVMKHLYAAPSTREIPVIIVTGSRLTKEDRSGLTQHTLISVEEKPIQMKTLLQKLEGVLLSDRPVGFDTGPTS